MKNNRIPMERVRMVYVGLGGKKVHEEIVPIPASLYVTVISDKVSCLNATYGGSTYTLVRVLPDEDPPVLEMILVVATLVDDTGTRERMH